MRKMLLLIGALVGFALITGRSRKAHRRCLAPGTIRITSVDVKVSLLNRGARSRGTGDVLLIRQLLYNKGIRKAADRSRRSRVHVHGPQSPAVQRDLRPPRGERWSWPDRSASVTSSGSPSWAERSSTTTCAARLTATKYTKRPRREILIFRRRRSSRNPLSRRLRCRLQDGGLCPASVCKCTNRT